MTVPFAISVHGFVNSVGAYVGLGSIVAVAILILLYFAHARETATLRERLDEAQQRIGGLEGRLAQLLQASQRARGPAAPGPVAPVPAPAGLRPAAAQSGAVRRVPSPATAAAATAPPAAARGATGPLLPAAPAGTGAPALASATKLIPDVAEAGAPDDTIIVPAAAAAAAAGNGSATAEHTAVLAGPAAAAAAAPAATATASVATASVATPPATTPPAPTPPAPTPAAATPPGAPAAATAAATTAATAAATAAAAAQTASASPRSAPPAEPAPPAPPRVQIAGEGERPGAAPAPSAGGGGIRRIGGHPQSPMSLPPLDDEPAEGRGFFGRVLPLLIAAVAIAVIIAGLIVVINTGNGTTAGNAGNNSGQTGQSLHKQQTKPVPFKASHVRVAVLNGTATSGLALDVGTKLAGYGYRKGNITNAASQTQQHTYVYYVARGKATKANRTAAQHVARALTLSQSRVRKAGGTVLQSCTISPSGTSLGAACSADVIVLVGQDRANLASSG